MKAKPLNLDRYRPLPGYSPVETAKLANVKLRLGDGGRLEHTPTERAFASLDRAYQTVRQLERLPAPGGSVHCVLTGAYSLFDFIPAIIELSGRKHIDELLIATLSFSKKNVEDLVTMADAGLIGSIAVLCSHYFSAADSEIYEQMVEQFRRHDFRVVAMRTHAKVLLLRIGDRFLTVEASANLRSCHNVENATVIDGADVFDFHAGWILDLIKRGEAGETSTNRREK